MTLLNNTHALLAGAGVVLSAACASTSITSSWKDPSAEPLKFDKILVVFMTPNSGIRRPAEDELVRLIERSEAVASYTMFPGDEARDEARAKAQIGDAGFDGGVALSEGETRARRGRGIPGTPHQARSTRHCRSAISPHLTAPCSR